VKGRYGMQLTESMKDELRAMWARKRAAGRMVCDAAGDMRPDGARGRAYHLDDLLSDIAHHPRRFAVRDTNIPEAHPPGPNAVTTPGGTNHLSAYTSQIAAKIAAMTNDKQVLAEIMERAVSAGPHDGVWAAASLILAKGDAGKIAAVVGELLNPQQGSAAPGAELSRGTHPTPEGGAAANTMRGEGEATERLPRAADSLEDCLPHRRNTAPSSLEGVVNAIRTKGKRA
jgi:hypothetical protein